MYKQITKLQGSLDCWWWWWLLDHQTDIDEFSAPLCDGCKLELEHGGNWQGDHAGALPLEFSHLHDSIFNSGHEISHSFTKFMSLKTRIILLNL